MIRARAAGVQSLRWRLLALTLAGMAVALVLGAVALAAGAAWGIHWWVSGRFIESTEDAYLKADSVTVAPKVGGYVAEVYVKADQWVKKGDPLVRLDKRQYQAALDQGQATIDARHADITRETIDGQKSMG